MKLFSGIIAMVFVGAVMTSVPTSRAELNRLAQETGKPRSSPTPPRQGQIVNEGDTIRIDS